MKSFIKIMVLCGFPALLGATPFVVRVSSDEKLNHVQIDLGEMVVQSAENDAALEKLVQKHGNRIFSDGVIIRVGDRRAFSQLGGILNGFHKQKVKDFVINLEFD